MIVPTRSVHVIELSGNFAADFAGTVSIILPAAESNHIIKAVTLKSGTEQLSLCFRRKAKGIL